MLTRSAVKSAASAYGLPQSAYVGRHQVGVSRSQRR